MMLTAAALLGVSSGPAQAAPPLSQTTKDAVTVILNELQSKTRPNDPRYLQNNVWVDGTPTCFRCTLGPGLLAAAHGKSTGLDRTLINTSIATFDVAIRTHQRPDGAFVPAAPGEGGPDIQTVLFANLLAEAYLVLGPSLDSAHKQAWSASLAKSADWLIRNGNLNHYVNGNINLAVAINIDLTYRITRLPRFQSAAAQALSFAVSPNQTNWRGFGLRYTKNPTKADGSDGAAFFAESGGGAPGYDPAYTLFQADMAAFWFLLTKSDTAKRLTNLLHNQLTPRVRTSDWTIDVGGGTRRPTPGVRYSFHVSSLSVLALKAGRNDLKPYVKSQTESILREYRAATGYSSPGMSYNYGAALAPTYLAVTSTLFM